MARFLILLCIRRHLTRVVNFSVKILFDKTSRPSLMQNSPPCFGFSFGCLQSCDSAAFSLDRNRLRDSQLNRVVLLADCDYGPVDSASRYDFIARLERLQHGVSFLLSLSLSFLLWAD